MPDDKRTPQTNTGPNSDEKTTSETSPTQESLTDFWNDILGPRPETIEQRLVRDLGLPHPGTFTLATSSGKKIVSIDPNGKVTYGEGIQPDEAAELFWTNMALKRVGMEQRLQHLAIMEAMLIRMGRADVNYERAQLAADAQGSGAESRAVAERARMNLEAIVHQVMDFARGLASRPEPTPPVVPAPPRPAERLGDPNCMACHGEGLVSTATHSNVPCPTCRPNPHCATCLGRGMVMRDSWSVPCPACRTVDRLPPTP